MNAANTRAVRRMPAEWERQEAVWLGWPQNPNDWPGKFAAIPWVFADIIRHLTRVVTVRLVVKNAAVKETALRICEQAGANPDRIGWFEMPTNRVWLRDSGPTFITEGGHTTTLLDWRFTAWAKYGNWKLDNAVPQTIASTLSLPVVQPVHRGKRVVMEGGAFDVNGQGVLLTTEECLLSRSVQVRNPGFTREDYEQVFAEQLGVSQVIWLGDGIAGDDTHGHVDDLARFISPSAIVTVVERDRTDANYAPLKENLRRLKKARDAQGKPFEVIELPMPAPLCFDGVRLPASYANFLISNGLVLVPTFNDPADRLALTILSDAMPKHEVIGIHAGDLVWGFGTLHCLSQQQPA